MIFVSKSDVVASAHHTVCKNSNFVVSLVALNCPVKKVVGALLVVRACLGGFSLSDNVSCWWFLFSW